MPGGRAREACHISITAHAYIPVGLEIKEEEPVTPLAAIHTLLESMDGNNLAGQAAVEAITVKHPACARLQVLSSCST